VFSLSVEKSFLLQGLRSLWDTSVISITSLRTKASHKHDALKRDVTHIIRKKHRADIRLTTRVMLCAEASHFLLKRYYARRRHNFYQNEAFHRDDIGLKHHLTTKTRGFVERSHALRWRRSLMGHLCYKLGTGASRLLLRWYIIQQRHICYVDGALW